MPSSTPAVDFKALFEAAPAKYVVVDPDFVIVAATDSWLREVLKNRDDILGKTVFEVFPENPDTPDANGAHNWRESMEIVLRTREMHHMRIQRYDIERLDGDGYEARYWQPLNAPLLDADGNVMFIIHGAENVTDAVQSGALSLD